MVSYFVAVHVLLTFAAWFTFYCLVPRFDRQFSDLITSHGFPPSDFSLAVYISSLVRQYAIIFLPAMLVLLWVDAKLLQRLWNVQKFWLAFFWGLGIVLLLVAVLLFVSYAMASPGLMIYEFQLAQPKGGSPP